MVHNEGGEDLSQAEAQELKAQITTVVSLAVNELKVATFLKSTKSGLVQTTFAAYNRDNSERVAVNRGRDSLLGCLSKHKMMVEALELIPDKPSDVHKLILRVLKNESHPQHDKIQIALLNALGVNYIKILDMRMQDLKNEEMEMRVSSSLKCIAATGKLAIDVPSKDYDDNRFGFLLPTCMYMNQQQEVCVICTTILFISVEYLWSVLFIFFTWKIQVVCCNSNRSGVTAVK